MRNEDIYVVIFVEFNANINLQLLEGGVNG